MSTRAQVEVSVAVVGGGVAGSLLAALLGRQGVDVHVFDDGNGRSLGRPGLLCRQSLALLENAGLPMNRAAIEEAARAWRLWWGTDTAMNLLGDSNEPLLPRHVHRGRLSQALQVAARLQGVRHFPGVSVKSWNRNLRSSGWSLDLGEHGRREALVLVDATGRTASVACSRGARRRVFDRLTGVCGRFELAPSTMLQSGSYGAMRVVHTESTPHGWWHAMPSNQWHEKAPVLDVSFMTDDDHPGASGSNFDYEWRRSRRLRPLLEEYGFRRVGELRRFDARSELLEPCVGSGWLAVGDAAASYDPLYVEGAFSGMEGVRLAVQAILAALDGGSLAYHGDAYAAWHVARFRHYLHARRLDYAREGRWPGTEFWSRRRDGLQEFERKISVA